MIEYENCEVVAIVSGDSVASMDNQLFLQKADASVQNLEVSDASVQNFKKKNTAWYPLIKNGCFAFYLHSWNQYIKKHNPSSPSCVFVFFLIFRCW